jgi:hypothetical protein
MMNLKLYYANSGENVKSKLIVQVDDLQPIPIPPGLVAKVEFDGAMVRVSAAEFIVCELHVRMLGLEPELRPGAK